MSFVWRDYNPKTMRYIEKWLVESEEIIGSAIHKCEATIYPSNIASKKAFENAGFKYDHTHEDEDAMYYVYESALNDYKKEI